MFCIGRASSLQIFPQHNMQKEQDGGFNDFFESRLQYMSAGDGGFFLSILPKEIHLFFVALSFNFRHVLTHFPIESKAIFVSLWVVLLPLSFAVVAEPRSDLQLAQSRLATELQVVPGFEVGTV